MTDKPQLPRFNEEEQQDYARLARLEYGPDLVNESHQRWESYTEEQREVILQEQDVIYQDMTQAMIDGLPATDPDVQDIMARWHQHIRYFYEPTLDILRGLGDTYVHDERFRSNFEEFHVDLPEYLQEGVVHYVDELETKVIEAMIAEDEARRGRLSL